MYPLRTTCRRATELLLASEDRALQWHERLSLRLHWTICAACVQFRDQTRLVRRALGRWKAYSDEATEDPAPPRTAHRPPP